MDEVVDPIRSNIAKNQVRDNSGKFVSKEDPTNLPPISVSVNNPTSVSTTNPPDLLNVKVTNPLVYIKYWWKRILANEQPRGRADGVSKEHGLRITNEVGWI